MSIRQRVYEDLAQRLHGITQARGYHTQPRICKNQQEALDCQEQAALWVYHGAETFDAMSLGGGQDASIELLIFALVKNDHGDLQTDSNLLLQDVRNCLSSMATRQAIHVATGAVFVGFDSHESDEGEYAHLGRMYWRQPVVWKYKATGESW